MRSKAHNIVINSLHIETHVLEKKEEEKVSHDEARWLKRQKAFLSPHSDSV